MRSFRQGSPAPQAAPRADSGGGRFGGPPVPREKSYARFPRYPQAIRSRLDLGESLFHEISSVWPKGADRKRPNLFPATAGAENRCRWSFGIAVRKEAKAGRLTKPPLCGSCGLVLERKRGWQASLSAQDLQSLRVERSENGRPRASAHELPGRQDANPSRHRSIGASCFGSVGQDQAFGPGGCVRPIRGASPGEAEAELRRKSK